MQDYPDDVSMWWDKNMAKESTNPEYLINYKIESMGGDSGGPLFKREEGGYYIVGVHFCGYKAKQYNEAVRLTNKVRATIN